MDLATARHETALRDEWLNMWSELPELWKPTWPMSLSGSSVDAMIIDGITPDDMRQAFDRHWGVEHV
jgi:hypothetical protein